MYFVVSAPLPGLHAETYKIGLNSLAVIRPVQFRSITATTKTAKLGRLETPHWIVKGIGNPEL